MEVPFPVRHELTLQFAYALALAGERPLTLKLEERVGGHETGLQVREGLDALVRRCGIRLLFDREGDEEAQLGDLTGDGLDVSSIDAVLDQVELSPEVTGIALEGTADLD